MEGWRDDGMAGWDKGMYWTDPRYGGDGGDGREGVTGVMDGHLMHLVRKWTKSSTNLKDKVKVRHTVS